MGAGRGDASAHGGSARRLGAGDSPETCRAGSGCLHLGLRPCHVSLLFPAKNLPKCQVFLWQSSRVPGSACPTGLRRSAETRRALGRRFSQGRPHVSGGWSVHSPSTDGVTFRFSKHSVLAIEICFAAPFFTNYPSRDWGTLTSLEKSTPQSRPLLKKE